MIIINSLRKPIQLRRRMHNTIRLPVLEQGEMINQFENISHIFIKKIKSVCQFYHAFVYKLKKNPKIKIIYTHTNHANIMLKKRRGIKIYVKKIQYSLRIKKPIKHNNSTCHKMQKVKHLLCYNSFVRRC
jgi:hypothetical protein